MNENIADHSSLGIEAPEEITRRRFFEKLSITLASFCAAVVGVPLIGFIIAPLFRKPPAKWVTLGKVNEFQIGKTVSVTVIDSSSLPWAGVTAKSAIWLRRESETSFIAFSANCTHLGCPVRWLESAELFMCPCPAASTIMMEAWRRAHRRSRSSLQCSRRGGEVKMNPVVVPITTTS
jgi:menaquinol-cytochrome c reductase iron-sulfur subunit